MDDATPPPDARTLDAESWPQAAAELELDETAAGPDLDKGPATCWYTDTNPLLFEPHGECDSNGRDGTWQRFHCQWTNADGSITHESKIVCRPTAQTD